MDVMPDRLQVSAASSGTILNDSNSASNRRIALVLLAQRMSRVVQFFRVVRNNIALFRRQLAALKR